jgi:diguanylate cyclase (GGDEF)-like protein
MKSIILKNYKFRIFFVISVGFMIVSIITALALYSIYQKNLLRLQSDADKIIKIYQHSNENLIKELEYFRLINFKDSDIKILENFNTYAGLFYKKNNFINGIGLVKQFDKKDLEINVESLKKATKRDNFHVIPLSKYIKESQKADNDNMLSVLINRIPTQVKRDVIGVDLSSEYNRKHAIDMMNSTNDYHLTAPLKVVNDDNGFNYSTLLCYPLYKENSNNFYTWYIIIPMTAQKVLNKFLNTYIFFDNFHIQLLEKIDNKYITISSTDPKNLNTQKMTTIKEYAIDFAHRDRKLIISAYSIITLLDYWPALLGFISGVVFLISIGYYLVFKEKNEIEIKRLSRMDHLTNAYNRIFFDEQIDFAIKKFNRYNTPFSAILIDIDYFKKINDTYGHTKGDEILVLLVKILKSSTRDTDIVARWGGEEFAVLLPSTSLDQATLVAQKLRTKIESYHFCSEFSVTCSMGVSEVTKNDTEKRLFKRIDEALYLAKENGRNRVETRI